MHYGNAGHLSLRGDKMKSLFAKSETMTAATRAAMEQLKAMPASDLLAFGAEHANSDIAMFLTESADDHHHEGAVVATSIYSGEYRDENHVNSSRSSVVDGSVVKCSGTLPYASAYKVEAKVPVKNKRSLPMFSFARISGVCGVASNSVPIPNISLAA